MFLGISWTLTNSNQFNICISWTLHQLDVVKIPKRVYFMAYDEQALKPADKRRSLGVTSFFLCDFYPPFIPHPRVAVQTVAPTGRMWTDETARTERGGRDGADRTGRTWKKVF